jgi:uncharacterized protein
MLFLISPAKTLDYDTPVPATVARHASEPLFTTEAESLIGTLRRQSPAQVAALMDLSAPLAALNVERYAAWQPVATPSNSKPAVLAFDGDVYDGLQAKTLNTADLRWAQDHVLILSGLYGALRPLDRLQPYRLEMGTALKTTRGKDLYAYWGDRVAELINQRLQGQRAPVVVNLASQEYARAALRPALQARVVEVVFEETNPDGSHQVISFFAKKARGRMLRFAVLQRARSLATLQAFAEDGYRLDTGASGAERLVFRRPRPAAVAPK